MRKNKEMENIGMFLKAAETYGVQPLDLFQVYYFILYATPRRRKVVEK